MAMSTTNGGTGNVVGPVETGAGAHTLVHTETFKGVQVLLYRVR
jgi:hypothetical protein